MAEPKDEDTPWFLIIVLIVLAVLGIIPPIIKNRKKISKKNLDYYRQKLAPALNETNGFLTISFIVIICLANVIMKTAPKYMISVDTTTEKETQGFVEWLSSAGLTWIPIIIPIVIVSVITILPFENKLLKIGLISLSLLGVFVTALFFGVLKKLFEKKKESFGHTDEKFLEDGKTHPMDLMINKNLGISVTTEGHNETISQKYVVKNLNVQHWNNTANIKADQTGNTKIFWSKNPFKDRKDDTLETLENIDTNDGETKGKDIGRTLKDKAEWKYYLHKIPNNIYVFNLSGDDRKTVTSESYCKKDVTTGLWNIVDNNSPTDTDFYQVSKEKGWVKAGEEIKKLSLMTNLPGVRILFWGDKKFYKTGKNPPSIEKKEGSDVNVSYADVVPHRNYTFGYADNEAYYFYNQRLKTGAKNGPGDDEDLIKALIGEDIKEENKYDDIFKTNFKDWKTTMENKNRIYVKDRDNKIANYNFIDKKIDGLKNEAKGIITNIVNQITIFNGQSLTGTTASLDIQTDYTPTIVNTDGDIIDSDENVIDLETRTGLDKFQLVVNKAKGEVNKTFLDRGGSDTKTAARFQQTFSKKQTEMLNILSNPGIPTSVQSLINKLEKLQKIRLHEINNLIRIAKKFLIFDTSEDVKNYIKVSAGEAKSNFKIDNVEYHLYHYAGGYSHVPGDGTKAQKNARKAAAQKTLTKIIKGSYTSKKVNYHSRGINDELLLRNNGNDTDFSKTTDYYNFVKSDYIVFQYKDGPKLHQDTCYTINGNDGTYNVYDYDVDFFDGDGLPILTGSKGANNLASSLTKLYSTDKFFRWGEHPYLGFNPYTHSKSEENGGLTSLDLDKDFKHPELNLSIDENGSILELKDQTLIFQNQLKEMEGSFNASYTIYYAAVWGSIASYIVFSCIELRHNSKQLWETIRRLAPFGALSLIETAMVSQSQQKYKDKISKGADNKDILSGKKITPVYSYAVGAYATRIATVVAFLSYILTHAKEG